MIEHLFHFWIAIDRPYKMKLRRMNGVIMVNTATIKSVFKYSDTKLYLYNVQRQHRQRQQKERHLFVTTQASTY